MDWESMISVKRDQLQKEQEPETPQQPVEKRKKNKKMTQSIGEKEEEEPSTRGVVIESARW